MTSSKASPEGGVRLKAEELTTAVSSILRAAGLSDQDASVVASILVRTEERGNPSHGVAHLFLYLTYLDEGRANPTARPTIVRQEGATAVMDAHRGLGPVAAVKAMNLALDLSDQYGIGAVSVRNAMTFSAAATYAEQALEHGQIGIAASNTGAIMAPAGGIDRILGNGPFAVAVPSNDEPFILDMACSTTARANIIMAAERGEEIDLGLAIDEHGNPTTDAAAALRGAVLPFGGYKGSGLALAIEFLTGFLSGAPLSTEDAVSPFLRPSGRSFTMIAIDVKRFVDLTVFRANVSQYLQQLVSSRSRYGDPILYPGLRAARAKDRMREGIAVPVDTVKRIQREAARRGAAAAISDWSGST